jgi:hypothetical protein
MNHAVHQESLENQVESALWYAQEAIESRKRTALSVSLILSRSSSIVNTYRSMDRDALFDEVNSYLESIETFNDLGQVDVQFHTRDLEAWVRSWDKDSFGMPLGAFRKGLVHVKETLTPHVSIELGKRLNIKAISPILLDEKFEGSVEVIVGFEGISQSLISRGIEFMVLLHKEHLDVAEWERNKNRVGDYTLISDTCPCKGALEIFAKQHRFEEGFLEDESRAYGFLPLFNVDAMPLGYFGVALHKDLNKAGNYTFMRPSNIAEHPFVPTIQELEPNKKVEIR